MRAKGKIKIPINKGMKIRLLMAIQKGELDIADFPELDGPQWNFYDFLTDRVPVEDDGEIDYNLSEK